MSEAKAEILRRIREATADGPVADPVQRTYRRTSSRDRAEVVEMLRDRLIDYRASVRDETEETGRGHRRAARPGRPVRGAGRSGA